MLRISGGAPPAPGAEAAPDRGYTWLAQGEEAAARLTYAGLDRRARAIAAALAGAVPPGERALLLYPPGLEFVAAFFGCLYAGVIAVPAYPPHSRRPDPRLAEHRGGLPSAGGADHRRAARPARGARRAGPRARARALARHGDPARGRSGRAVASARERAEDIAFLQYTSGSTGTPKGVMVTHANLLHNLERIRHAFGQTAESVVVGWLPLFHDMGLIGNVLEPCYVGSDCVLMSPAAFLQKPARWLQAIHRFRGTTSGGPNFAYDLCVRSVGPEAREELDLSSWSVAFNGAEPVRRATLDRFAEAFAPCGFRREAFVPCYGLAEATLLVTAARGVSDGPRRELRRRSRPATRCASSIRSRAAPVPAARWGRSGSPGRAWPRATGTGPRRRARRSERCCEDGGGPYLRTGRSRLRAARRAVRHRPAQGPDHPARAQPLSAGPGADRGAVPSGPARRGRRGVLRRRARRGERLVVVHEVERHAGDLGAIADAVRRAVAEEHGVRVADVVLLRAGTIPKTSSGKIRRRECRALYLAGDLAALYRRAAPRRPLRGGCSPASTCSLSIRRSGPPRSPPGCARRSPAAPGWPRSGSIRRRRSPPPGWIPWASSICRRGWRRIWALALPSASLAELSIAELRDRLLDALAARSDGTPICRRSSPARSSASTPSRPGQEALWFLEQSSPTEGVLHIAAAARLGAEVDGAALLRAARGARGAPPGSAHHVRDRTASSASGSTRACRPIWRRWMRRPGAPEELDDGPAARGAAAVRPGRRARRCVSGSSPVPAASGSCCSSSITWSGDFWSLAVLLRDWAALYARQATGRSRTCRPSYTDFVRWQRAPARRPGRRAPRALLARPPARRAARARPAHRPAAPAGRRPRGRPARPAARSRADRAGARARPGRTGPPCSRRSWPPSRPCSGASRARTTSWSAPPPPGGATAISTGSSATSSTRSCCGPIWPAIRRSRRSSRGPAGPWPRRWSTATCRFRGSPGGCSRCAIRAGRRSSRSSSCSSSAAPGQEPGLAAFAVGQAGARIELEGLALESLPLDPGTAQLDLTLSAAEAGDALVLSCEHDTALFDASDDRALARASARPCSTRPPRARRRRLGELPLLTDAELHQARSEWNPSENPPGAGPDESLVERFESWADRTPEAVAAAAAGLGGRAQPVPVDRRVTDLLDGRHRHRAAPAATADYDPPRGVSPAATRPTSSTATRASRPTQLAPSIPPATSGLGHPARRRPLHRVRRRRGADRRRRPAGARRGCCGAATTGAIATAIGTAGDRRRRHHRCRRVGPQGGRRHRRRGVRQALPERRSTLGAGHGPARRRHRGRGRWRVLRLRRGRRSSRGRRTRSSTPSASPSSMARTTSTARSPPQWPIENVGKIPPDPDLVDTSSEDFEGSGSVPSWDGQGSHLDLSDGAGGGAEPAPHAPESERSPHPRSGATSWRP